MSLPCLRLRAASSAALALGFAACAGTAPPAAKTPPAPCTLPTKIKLEASERINPDTSGEALPTVVRVYQLKAIERVEQADFVAVWEKPQDTLGPDLLGVREFTMFPGQAELTDVALGPDTKFLVGVAIFRRPTGTQWRSIIPLPESPKLCAAYGKRRAPEPAVAFRFDQYRVEGRSRLLTGRGDHDLPMDVAPDRKQNGKKP